MYITLDRVVFVWYIFDSGTYWCTNITNNSWYTDVYYNIIDILFFKLFVINKMFVCIYIGSRRIVQALNIHLYNQITFLI